MKLKTVKEKSIKKGYIMYTICDFNLTIMINIISLTVSGIAMCISIYTIVENERMYKQMRNYL